ncbi:MAG: hypothetical protein M3131_02780, partial [Actinomycetota bacterium]|nr:hypothetical protein [Actinomycetota bacterium]
MPFLGAAEIQPDPFTPPADVRRATTVKGAGPFGGTGSKFVCDRERLIRFLRARPDHLREWARVQGVWPRAPGAVARYIRSLRPSTLVRDTRVTNHSYRDGRAKPFQAVLAAGTAVLVDKEGTIRVRCRCGNPLLDPVFVTRERWTGAPPGRKPIRTWRLATYYYYPYPNPPRVRGEELERRPRTPRRVTVTRIVPETGRVTVAETAAGGTRTVIRTRTIPIRTLRTRSGPRGPAGPRGPIGLPGPTGPAGPPG